MAFETKMLKKTKGLSDLSSFIRIFYFAAFSIFLLKNKIYRHQKFSIIVILIVIIIVIVLLPFFINYNEDYFKPIIVVLLLEIIYCSKYVSGIIYLMNSQGIIYKLLFFNGVIGLILSSLLQFSLSFLNCKNGLDYYYDTDKICHGEKINTVIDVLKDIKLDQFLIFTILLIIVNFILLVCIWLLIYYYSLMHYATIYIIPSFIMFLLDIEEPHSIEICYIIMFNNGSNI